MAWRIQAGQPDQALTDYDEALKINPSAPAAFYGRGVAKLMKGDIAASNADFEVAKQLKPSIAEEFSKVGVQAKPKSFFSASISKLSAVSPERAEGASPESRAPHCGPFVPGSAFRVHALRACPGMTEQELAANARPAGPIKTSPQPSANVPLTNAAVKGRNCIWTSLRARYAIW